MIRWCTRLFEVRREDWSMPSMYIQVLVPHEFRPQVEELLQKAYNKHNGHLTFTLDAPHRPRSTGWKSQSHHIWGHAAQIGQHLGYDRREMVYLIAEMTPSWPMAEYKGKMVPKSESEISSETASEAIEVAHRIAAENGIRLVENDDEKETY